MTGRESEDAKGKVHAKRSEKSRNMSLQLFTSQCPGNPLGVHAQLTDLPRWPGLNLSCHARHCCATRPELSFTPSGLQKRRSDVRFSCEPVTRCCDSIPDQSYLCTKSVGDRQVWSQSCASPVLHSRRSHNSEKSPLFADKEEDKEHGVKLCPDIRNSS